MVARRVLSGKVLRRVPAIVAACLGALGSLSSWGGGPDVHASGGQPADSPTTIVLPARLPAACIQLAADDFGVPASVLLAMLKVESNGHRLVSRNANGTWDIGVAQHNSASWVPYFERHYGITPQALAQDVCQSVRAQAYVLRREIVSSQCAGVDLWCAVARYHSPRNAKAQQRYLAKVQHSLQRMLRSGRFDFEQPAR